MEKTRLIIQFSGYSERGNRTDKKFTILNIDGEVTMEIIKNEIVKNGSLSPFRSNKDIDIHYMQAF